MAAVLYILFWKYLRRIVGNQTFPCVWTTKTQIGLCIHGVWQRFPLFEMYTFTGPTSNENGRLGKVHAEFLSIFAKVFFFFFFFGAFSFLP